jgi:hypothetical protein
MNFTLWRLSRLCKQESHNIVISFTWQASMKRNEIILGWLVGCCWRKEKRKNFSRSQSLFAVAA